MQIIPLSNFKDDINSLRNILTQEVKIEVKNDKPLVSLIKKDGVISYYKKRSIKPITKIDLITNKVYAEFVKYFNNIEDLIPENILITFQAIDYDEYKIYQIKENGTIKRYSELKPISKKLKLPYNDIIFSSKLQETQINDIIKYVKGQIQDTKKFRGLNVIYHFEDISLIKEEYKPKFDIKHTYELLILSINDYISNVDLYKIDFKRIGSYEDCYISLMSELFKGYIKSNNAISVNKQDEYINFDLVDDIITLVNLKYNPEYIITYKTMLGLYSKTKLSNNYDILSDVVKDEIYDNIYKIEQYIKNNYIQI